MTTKIRLNKWRFAAVIFALTLGLPAGAQIQRVIFPIPQLGNCSNQQACKRFCDLPDHQTDCRLFAEANGLNHTRGQATATSTDDKLLKILADGGPGNCAVKSADPKATCAEFCSTLANASICVQYAEKHRLGPVVKAEPEAGRSIKTLSTTTPPVKNGRNAPPKVADCLKEQLGESKTGVKIATPDKLSPEARAKVRDCFEQGVKIYQRGSNTALTPRATQTPPPNIEPPRPAADRRLQGAALGLLRVFLPLTSFGY